VTKIPLPPNPRVAVLGDFVADVVCTIPSLPVEAGRHQLADSILVEPGGAGNFVVAAHRLGLNVALFGVMGADNFGSQAAQALEAVGISTSGLIRQAGGSTTTVIVLVDPAGRHVFLGTYGSGPEVVAPQAWREQIKSAAALFVSGYSLHEERLCKAALACIEFAHEHQVPLFFDPGPHVRGLSGDLIRKVIDLSQVILLTEDEIPLITDSGAGLENCRLLLKRGPQMICIKRGAQGCIVMTGEKEISHPGFPVVVRDTTAAGDTFAAAFIYGILCGWDLSAIATFANAMGAAKVQKLGSGTCVPALDDVLKVLQDHGVNFPFLTR